MRSSTVYSTDHSVCRPYSLTRINKNDKQSRDHLSPASDKRKHSHQSSANDKQLHNHLSSADDKASRNHLSPANDKQPHNRLSSAFEREKDNHLLFAKHDHLLVVMDKRKQKCLSSAFDKQKYYCQSSAVKLTTQGRDVIYKKTKNKAPTNIKESILSVSSAGFSIYVDNGNCLDPKINIEECDVKLSNLPNNNVTCVNSNFTKNETKMRYDDEEENNRKSSETSCSTSGDIPICLSHGEETRGISSLSLQPKAPPTAANSLSDADVKIKLNSNMIMKTHLSNTDSILSRLVSEDVAAVVTVANAADSRHPANGVEEVAVLPETTTSSELTFSNYPVNYASGNTLVEVRHHGSCVTQGDFDSLESARVPVIKSNERNVSNQNEVIEIRENDRTERRESCEKTDADKLTEPVVNVYDEHSADVDTVAAAEKLSFEGPIIHLGEDSSRNVDYLHVLWVDEESEVVCKEDNRENSIRQITKRERDRLKKRVMRANPEYREKETAKARLRMKMRRLDPEYREQERRRDRDRRRQARLKSCV